MGIKLLLYSAFFTFGLSGFAQEQDSLKIGYEAGTENDSVESFTLSLEEAKIMALDYNYDLKNASLAIQEAEAAKRETVAAALPQINASADFTTFFGASNTMDGLGEIEFNNTSNFNASASMFFSGTYLVAVQLSKLAISLAEKTQEQTDLSVKQQVVDAYYAILLAERTKEILDQNIDNLIKVYGQTEMMYKAGVAELTDVDQISIQVTMLESSLRTTNRQIASAYDMLKLQIGINPSSTLQLTETLDDFFAPESFYIALLRAFNIDENIDYQLMEQQVGISEKQIKLAKMEYAPTLSASYNHLEQIIAPNFNMSPKNTMTFSLNIPIFSSGQRKAKVDQAKLRHETTKNSQDQLSDALVIQDRTIKRNLQTALDQYDAQDKNVEVAKRVYENINRKYEAGMESSLNLTTANTNYLNAESSYIQAMMDVLQAYIELEKFYNNL
ncbi:MAG: TolC family protein [Mangrovibacterium sp.]